MDDRIIEAFIDKVDAINLVLIVVIFLLAWLLYKSLSRIDSFASDFRENSILLERLTTLIEALVFGRKKDK